MISYWIVTYSIMLLAFFEINNRDRKDQSNRLVILYFFIMMTVVLIIFSGVRGINSGIDDLQYVDFYDQASPGMSIFGFDQVKGDYRYESFFLYLAYISSFFTTNGYVFIFFIALMSVSINSITYKKYSELMLVSLCFYSAHLFINKDMNQIRFGLSSAFGMLSVFFCLEKKWLLFLFFLILSTQSHSTGYALLIFFPFLLFPRLKYLPVYVILISIPIGLIGGKSLILDHIGVFSSLSEKVEGYEGTEFDTVTPVLSLGNLKNLFIIVFYISIVWGRRKITQHDGVLYGLILFYAIGASIRIVFSDFSIIGGRVGSLFLQVEPIIISVIIFRLRSKYLGMLFLFLMVTYYLLYNTVLSAQSIYGYDISPYFDIL